MNSIISFPNRGHWGQSSYRGNCSGYVQKELIEQYNAKYFVDVCEGGGTSRDVCHELGIEYTGLDLRTGNDYTRDSISSQILRPADIVFSHSAYHNMIQYSGNMWGEANANDHSRCETIAEYLEKSQVMLLNQREATRDGGMYCTLIGDMRKQGQFHSFQADFIKMMPNDELKGVVIKVQHNTMSGNKQYRNFKHPSIEHEYLILWEKSKKTMVQVVWDKAIEQKKAIVFTWRSLIRVVMMSLGKASLISIYKEVEILGSELIINNKNWKAKVRQQLQIHHENVERGVWAV